MFASVVVRWRSRSFTGVVTQLVTQCGAAHLVSVLIFPSAFDPSRRGSGPATEGQARLCVYMFPVTFLARWLACVHSRA